MVSVDDLVISLKIDTTSNLGKLQKQLEALVGEKGEKAIEIGIGIDPALKRDLTEIKADLMLLTPTVLTSKETVMRAAYGLTNRIKAEKGLTELLLERYDMEEERLEEFIEELLKISTDSSKLNNDQRKRFVAEMIKFTAIADMSEGDRKTIVTRLLGMLNEVAILQQKVQESFRAAGVRFRGQYQVYQVTKTTIDNQFNEQIKHYEGIDEDRFDKLKVIFKDISDPLRAMEAAYKLMNMGILDIEQLDKKTIQDVAELKEILIAQIAASLKDSTYMLEDFYKAGKELTGGKRFGTLGPKYLDLVVKDGLKAFFDEHGGIIKFGEITDIQTNILTELKLVATKQDIEKTVQERINQGFTDIVLVAEEIKDTAIDAAKELLSKEIYKDINIALVEILPRVLQLSTGTAADLQKMREEASKVTQEEIDKIAEVIEATEATQEEIKKTADKLDDTQKDLKYNKDERETERGELADFLNEWNEEFSKEGKSNDMIEQYEREAAKQLEEARKDLKDLKITTEDTNKEVKKKSDEPERVEEVKK